MAGSRTSRQMTMTTTAAAKQYEDKVQRVVHGPKLSWALRPAE